MPRSHRLVKLSAPRTETFAKWIEYDVVSVYVSCPSKFPLGIMQFTTWAYNPGGGGGGYGGTCLSYPPHAFSGGGHNIKCSPPPPHVLGVGWILVDITTFTRFLHSLKGILFVCHIAGQEKLRDVGRVPPTHFDLREFRRRWRSGKKSGGQQYQIKKVGDTCIECPPHVLGVGWILLPIIAHLDLLCR